MFRFLSVCLFVCMCVSCNCLLSVDLLVRDGFLPSIDFCYLGSAFDMVVVTCSNFAHGFSGFGFARLNHNKLAIFASGCILVFACLFVSMFVFLCIWLCVSVPVYLSVCLFVCLSPCLSVFVFVCLSICLAVCLLVCLFMFVYLPVCLSVCLFGLSVCVSV